MAAPDGVFPDVCQLSSDEELPGQDQCRKGKKRKKQKQDGSQPELQAVSTEKDVRAMRGNPKCHCRQGCLNPFSEASAVKELVEFRSRWSELHKLDQDQEDS